MRDEVPSAFRGNAQLPGRDGFMANDTLVRAAVDAVASRRARARGGSFLYVSSNVEDVAIEMRAAVERAARGRLRAVGASELLQPSASAERGETAAADPRTVFADLPIGTLRQAKHAQRGGERAHGAGWLPASPLPRRARSETEVLCGLEGKPVFRCLFVPVGGE